LVPFAAALFALVLGGVDSQAEPEGIEVQFVEPERSEVPLPNTTGHLDLVWSVFPESAPEPATYELQGSRDRDFSAPIDYYSGVDQRSFLSGLAEGPYFFRVRSVTDSAGPGEWSEVLAIEVDYVDQWKVFVLMGLGFVCLTATVLIIVRGSLRTGDYAKDVF